MSMLSFTVNLQIRVWLQKKAEFWQANSIKTDLLHKSQRKQIKVFQIQTKEESHGFMEIC